MKRSLILTMLLVLTALAVAAMQAPRLLTPWICRQIEQAMPGSKVSIDSLSGNPLSSLTFSNIRIEDAHSKFSFGSASLHYSVSGLFQKKINLLALRDGEVIYHDMSQPMPMIRFGSTSGPKKQSVTLEKLSIQDLRLDLETQDLVLSGKLSFTRDMILGRFLDGLVHIPKLTVSGVQIKELRTSLDYSQHGILSAQQISFQKWAMNDLRATYELTSESLDLDLGSVIWLGTALKGKGQVRFMTPPIYSLRVQVDAVPMKEILTAYEWDKKLSVSGQLGGYIELAGQGPRLTELKGRIQNLTDGNIVILDQAFLQRIADSAKQPIEIIKASFENYHYNTGDIAVSLDNQNIRLGIDLNGEAGKRNLEVYLHDLF